MSSTEEEYSVVDWTNLPRELLDVILHKLIKLPDYIRFGAVCKAWLSVAVDQKQQRITKNVKEPPMLLITIPDKAHSDFHGSKIWDSLFNFKLCCFSDDDVYSYKFQFPHRSRHLGSFHGWLAIEEFNLSVTLINPFTGKNVHLPKFNLCPCDCIDKIILSCDPAKCPDECIVAAIYNSSDNVAFIRPGEKSWTTAFGCVSDIIFHKGMLYALRKTQQLIAIDCGFSSHSRNPNDQLPPNFEIVPPKFVIGPVEEYISNSRIPLLSWLVESLNGSLLLVQKLHLLTQNPVPGFKYPVHFKVYKLVKRLIPSSNEEEADWLEIQGLEKDEIIFLDYTHSMCISSSDCQNWHSNSIYFLQDFEHYWNLSRHHESDNVQIGVFHLDDKRLRKFYRLNDLELERYGLPTAWISPTLQ